ncbi:polyketide cyclase [Exilibacterium tricleocarpae]|uniref:Polyketide cyclase n=1 Tax=Exilibacterium tricleocarpae TaxID=2591008 RepID=A0A545TV87_9GAMM|nr:SRPBCC family protein [Exilibacterium tricleocarpae]TQV81136.1 polyketide cyclase [Exilibacterium tricleocarpae]
MGRNDSIVVEAQMLIHKPVAQVFEAFVNPKITTKFWFTKSSGRLEPGKKVRWDWEMFGVGDDLTVKEFEENRRIVVEWNNNPTIVEWRFEPRKDGAALVKISNKGFGDEVLPLVVDAKGGYTMVLAGLKAWLEHGIELNLVRDQFPDGCPS